MGGGVRVTKEWFLENYITVDGVTYKRDGSPERPFYGQAPALKSEGMIEPPQKVEKTPPPAPWEAGTGSKKSPIQKLNRLERAFYDWMIARPERFSNVRIHAFTLLLANDCRYTPDFSCKMDFGGGPVVTFIETKGPYFWEDAKIKLKVAAALYSEFAFLLVTKRNNDWESTRVSP